MPASYCPAVQSRVKLPAVKHDLMVPHCFHTSSNLCSKCRMQATASVQFSPQQFTRGDWHALQGARKIDFAAFERTLPLLAKEKGVPPEEVRRAIVLSGGPSRNTSVTPDFVRLHDDKSTFTGDSPSPLSVFVSTDTVGFSLT